MFQEAEKFWDRNIKPITPKVPDGAGVWWKSLESVPQGSKPSTANEL